MTRPRCTWVADHWRTPEHLRDCDTHDCHGCAPCPKNHCELNGRCPNHVDHDAGIFTCPSCIGKARRTLRTIEQRYTTEMPLEAIVAGIESEAANLLGPAAAPEQWSERRRRITSTYDTRGWCDYPRHDAVAADDPHHPYAVLGRWDIRLRDWYGHTTDLFISVSRAVDYLAGDILNTFAHTKEFPEFMRDITACLTHLETVLSDSRTPEKGAPCPTCSTELEHAPRLLKRYGRDITGKGDTWHCPINTAHWWTDTDYRARIDADYLQHATALTAGQMHEAHGIKPGTLRAWASLGKVAKRGKNPNGVTLYDVAQARAAVSLDEQSSA